MAIKSFQHKGLENLFKKGSKAGIKPEHADRLRARLAHLDAARSPLDMNLPGWYLHELKGDMAGRWSVTVSGNWRMTFEFEGSDAILVGYEDYH